MTPELLGEAIVDFAFLAVFLGVLGIGALIADYVFPHIRSSSDTSTACLITRTTKR